MIEFTDTEIENMPIYKLAKTFGITVSVLYNRIKKGMSRREAISAKVCWGGSRAKKYVVDGIEDTIKGHSKRYGIKYATVKTRTCVYGITLEQALKKSTDKHLKHTIQLTAPEISYLSRRNLNDVYEKLKIGWSVHDILFKKKYCSVKRVKDKVSDELATLGIIS